MQVYFRRPYHGQSQRDPPAERLGLTHWEIADSAGCGRNTVTRTLARVWEQQFSWQQAQSMP